MSLLQAWLDSKSDLEIAKETELALRMQLTKENFKNVKLKEGVNKVNLEDSVLTLDYKVNRTVDKENLLKIKDSISDFDKLFKTEYSLRVGEYKKMDKEEKFLIDRCITAKPGLPQITFRGSK